MTVFTKLAFYGACISVLIGSVASAAAAASTSVVTPGCKHGPHSRGCWKNGFDINTDYEKKIPPGKLVEYDFTVSNKVMAPDGYLTNMTVINGQFPGPTVEADWGDTIRITVHNNLTNLNGTSIHWHGIRQFQTNWEDGVPGVTQCPSKPGETQVFEFRAMQYGTAWYHSHFSLQYTNGAFGPIVIHGPSSMDYDEDLGPLLIGDWYHADAFSLFWVEILTPHAPLPPSTLINGQGFFDCSAKNDTRCTGTSKRHELSFKKGRKYKLRLANTGSLLTLKFWIDGHKFTVIANDFVPVEPYETDVIIIGIAQRYDIIVEANADFEHGTNFWIHANYCDDDTWESKVGIVRYDPRNTSLPYTPTSEAAQHYGFGCMDPSPADLTPIVPRQVGKNVNGMAPYDWLKIGLQAWPNVSDTHPSIQKWVLGNKTQLIDWREPAVRKLVIDANMDFSSDTVPLVIDYDTDEWVYFVIENNYTLTDAPQPQTNPPSVHPLHLHGHDFVILAQDKGPFSKDVVPLLDNPARRDVVNVPIGGYVWIAFQINNPGAWLMHCHIAWHASAGLSLQFIEQPGKLKPLMQRAGVLEQFEKRCEEWTEFYNGTNIPQGVVQDDSGI